MAGGSRMNMGLTGSMGGGGHVSHLVATVADQLGMHIQSGHPPDSAEFSDLCLSLGRGIDNAVANNEIPVGARDLPLVLKQVLRCMNDSSLQAVSVLMISVKNACKIGWFPDHDANDLLTLATEIGKNFSTMEGNNVQPSYLLNARKIMFRYYPRIRMGHMLASLDVKSGYLDCMVDFHITKSMLSPANKHICLFVAQTDDMETSSCIVFPPKVNFLLNGKGVWGRINSSMDNGPLLPINVTAMLKYGKNLLQVVGRFKGNYVIIVAFMSMISISNTPELQDYIQPVAVTSDSDLDVIEGQARVSLNCPISFKRINIPVKGHLCKHHQCFDYSNFMEINSRRPSWRCPHCNQSVCNPDMRIDQRMVKVLKEVEENVVDVIIFPDGSWKLVAESIEHTTRNNQPENSELCESANIVDLTMSDDDENEAVKSLPETLGVHRKTELPVSSLQNRYPSAGNIEVQKARFASSVPSNEYGMVGIGNPGASQVMGRSRNIVHPSVHVQPKPPVQRRHGADHAGQERTQMPRMPAQFQQEARTGTRFSYALVAEQLRATAMEQRRGDLTGRTGLAAEQLGTPWSSLRAESRAENWQAPGIMRGSLTGQADSAAAISQFMLLPPTSLTSTLESRLQQFWRFPGTGNDQNGMYSQAAAQGRLRSNWGGSGSGSGSGKRKLR